MDDVDKRIEGEVKKKKVEIFVWYCSHPHCPKIIPSLYMKQVVSQAKKHLETHNKER